MGQAGQGRQGRAGQAVGRCSHRAAMGHRAAALAPSCPVLPGTGVRRVCSAWPSSTIPVAPSRRPCWEEGCSHGAHWQGPHRCQWCWCRSRATVVGSCRHTQPCANPPPPLGVGGWRGVPPCQGAAWWHSPGSTSQGARSHSRTCPHHTKGGLASPRVGWHLLTLQQPGRAPGPLRGDGNSQHQFVTVKFCLPRDGAERLLTIGCG